MPGIVIADQHRYWLRIFAQKFDCATIPVHITGSGVAAMRLMEQHEPQLVIVDYGLQDLRGPQFVQTVRRNEKTATLPIIIYSNQPHSDWRKVILADSHSIWLYKYDHDVDQLAITVQGILEEGNQ